MKRQLKYLLTWLFPPTAFRTPFGDLVYKDETPEVKKLMRKAYVDNNDIDLLDLALIAGRRFYNHAKN